MARIKICGLTSVAALRAAAAADWVGFVFYPSSPRFVSPARAAALAAEAPAGPARVGLFVDPTDDEVAAVLDALPLDILQVHAAPTRAAALRARFGRPVWHAIGVGTAADLPQAAPGVDGLLLDAKPPAGVTRPGGNARPFDWSLLRGWTAPRPWLLAGGLTAENVADAIRTTGADAVDVSSGVESRPGEKDPALVAAFIRAAQTVSPVLA